MSETDEEKKVREEKEAAEKKAAEAAASASSSKIKKTEREKRIDEGLQKTEKAVEELKKLNEEKRILNSVERELQDRKELAGKGEAGQAAKSETAEEKWSKDAKKRYEGTGMDHTPDEDSGPVKYS